MLSHMRQITFYQTTRRRPLGWGSAYQTLQRPGFLRSGRGPPGRGEGFESWAPPGEMGFCHHPFFNYQTARRGERQPCCLFRFIFLQRIEREGYGGTSTRLYGAWARACYQTVRRLSSLSL